MLVPLTRNIFEQLIPAVATSEQYSYCWGSFPDVIKRVSISAVGVSLIVIIHYFVHYSSFILLISGLIFGLYWFWGPVLSASLKNIACRRYQYAGFWQGRVLDVYVTEEVIGQEETVNQKGQLVVVENLEARINLEVGDRQGFTTTLQTPLKKFHRDIQPGQAALMVVMSNRPDLAKIDLCSDIYIPSRKIWVSDYPYLRRDVFIEVSNEIKTRLQNQREQEIDLDFSR